MLLVGPMTVLGPFRELERSFLLLDGPRIAGLFESPDAAGSQVPGATPPGTRRIVPSASAVAVPGLIDLQVNGAHGHDLAETPEAIWEVAALLPRHGVTSFLPTLVSCTADRIRRALAVVGEGPPPGFRGAMPLGIYLEGPFLDPRKKGAHDAAMLRSPLDDPEPFWLDSPAVRMVTVAPGLPGSLELIEKLHERGIIVSLGHSAADLATSRQALAAGATCGTHLYNGMSGLAHRDPGLALALLLERRVRVGLIADGVHCHPALVDLSWRMKGADGLFLVSDAVSATGVTGESGPPSRRLWNDGTRITLADGTLSGSAAMLDVDLRNLMEWTGCSLAQAVRTATVTPAAILGLSSAGHLAVDGPADIALLDGDGVSLTIVRGEVVFERE